MTSDETKEILEKLSKLNDDEIIFYLRLVRDLTKHQVVPAQFCESRVTPDLTGT